MEKEGFKVTCKNCGKVSLRKRENAEFCEPIIDESGKVVQDCKNEYHNRKRTKKYYKKKGVQMDLFPTENQKEAVHA